MFGLSALAGLHLIKFLLTLEALLILFSLVNANVSQTRISKTCIVVLLVQQPFLHL